MSYKEFLLGFSRFLSTHRLLLLIFLVLSVNLFYKAGLEMSNDDAQLWFNRTDKFMNAIEEFRFQDTDLSSKPGVTLMWLSGIPIRIATELIESVKGVRITPMISAYYPTYITIALLPQLILAFLSFVLFYFIIKELYSEKIALLSLGFLGLEPFYMGLHRWYHVESLLSTFFVSYILLLILMIVRKKFENGNIIFLSILLGLAFLSKSQALYLIPFSAIAFLSYYLSNKSHVKISDVLVIFVKILSISSFVFALLYPAIWTDTKDAFELIFTQTRDTLTNPLNDIQPWNFYFYAIFSRLSPLSLLFFLFSPIVLLRKKFSTQTFLIYFFIASYFVGISILSQKIDRYMMVIFPFIAIITALALDRILANLKIFSPQVLLFFIFLAHGSIYYLYTPTLTGFYNPIFGGKYFITTNFIVDSAGEYLPEVVKILESTTDKPEDLVILTNIKSTEMRPFAKGKVYSISEEIPSELTIDFLVVSNDAVSATGYPMQCRYALTFELHKYPHWHIFDCR